MTSNERRAFLGLGCLGLLVVMCALGLGGALYFSDGLGDEGGAASQEVAQIVEEVQNAAEEIQEKAPAMPTVAALRPLRERREQAEAEREGLPLRGVDLGTESDLARLYEQVNPGAVSLSVRQVLELGGQQLPQMGSGSGFVYDDQHIVTNNHVVGGSDQVEVVFYDGQRREGQVVGSDAYSDLAVVRVEGMPETARPLPLAQAMEDLKVGQPVVAIGNPFGRANSMTYGIISALGRTIPADGNGAGGGSSFSIPETIQTDAPINPGNSGGPLLDLSGQVVGVNAQINTNNVTPGGTPGNSGVGFAIPASIVARVAPVLIARGSYDWPYLGVGGLPQEFFTVDVAEANRLPEARGAYILNVLPDGPSSGKLRGAENLQGDGAAAGLDDVPQGGDVVVAIDGEPVGSFDDLLTYIAISGSPGQTVTLTVLRDGASVEVPVVLASRPREN